MQGNFFDGGKILWQQKLGKKQSAIKCMPTTAALCAVFIVVALIAAIVSEDEIKITRFFV